MTKIHESFVVYHNVGVFPDVATARGEFTVVLGPLASPPARMADPADVHDLVVRLTERAGIDDVTALAMAGLAFGIDERLARKLAKKGRLLVKRTNDAAP